MLDLNPGLVVVMFELQCLEALRIPQARCSWIGGNLLLCRGVAYYIGVGSM